MSSRAQQHKPKNPPATVLPVAAAPPSELPLSDHPHAVSASEGGLDVSNIPRTEEQTPEPTKAKVQIAFWRGANEYPMLHCMLTSNPRYLAGKLIAKDVDEACKLFRQFLERALTTGK
jgi:hypothetical protein